MDVNDRVYIALRNSQAVASFLFTEKSEFAFLVAAKVVGIIANNTYKANS